MENYRLLVYRLNLLGNLLKNENWIPEFMKSGGSFHLLNLLFVTNAQFKSQEDLLLVCDLVRLILKCDGEDQLSNLDSQTLTSFLCFITQQVQTVAFLRKLLWILTKILKCNQSRINDFPEIGFILKEVIFHRSIAIRELSVDLFSQIPSESRQTILLPHLDWAFQHNSQEFILLLIPIHH
jgi:hypothetical protein